MPKAGVIVEDAPKDPIDPHSTGMNLTYT
jgi:hypothetical protein